MSYETKSNKYQRCPLAYGATATSFSGGVAGEVTNGGGTLAVLTVNQSIATTFSGSLRDGTSQFGLDLGGTGSLTLLGTNTYTGGTTVAGGTLIVASPAAIDASGIGTNLSVGSELGLFGTIQPAAQAAGVPAGGAAAVPEPGTLWMLATGATGALLMRRRRE